MANDLLYRTGSPGDLQQLKELSIISYSEFSKVLTPENWEIMNGNLRNEEKLSLLIEQSTVFECLHNRQIVGVAYLMPHGYPTAIYPAHWSYIRMVGVLPDYRGQGIARTLTQQCIAHAREAGEKIIGLHTSEVMNAARHVYESLGFKAFKEIDPIFGVKYWLYKLDLTG